MRNLARLLVIVVFACFPLGLLAQQAACVNGQSVPYFGWDGTECVNCVIRGAYIEFLAEPKISSIRSDGPAAGLLREHDTLMAVDGFAITTPEAWHRLRDVKPGEQVHFKVRNEDGERDETVRAAARCLPISPKPKVIIVRRKRATL